MECLALLCALCASEQQATVFFATGAVCQFSALRTNARNFVAAELLPLLLGMLSKEGWARRHAVATIANLAVERTCVWVDLVVNTLLVRLLLWVLCLRLRAAVHHAALMGALDSILTLLHADTHTDHALTHTLVCSVANLSTSCTMCLRGWNDV